MIDAGLPVVLATDYNPGSTPSGNMPFTLSLACTQMQLLPAEAIQATTVNGAFAMELGHDLGTIARGMQANLIITKNISSIDFVPYAYGSDSIDKVYIKGIAQ